MAFIAVVTARWSHHAISNTFHTSTIPDRTFRPQQKRNVYVQKRNASMLFCMITVVPSSILRSCLLQSHIPKLRSAKLSDVHRCRCRCPSIFGLGVPILRTWRSDLYIVISYTSIVLEYETDLERDMDLHRLDRVHRNTFFVQFLCFEVAEPLRSMHQGRL